MQLNTLKPAPGSKKTRMRVGRGTGCGNGKTCGRGMNGQWSRSGGYQKTGFEGGQTPLQRRLPKFGFKSLKALQLAEIKLEQLVDLSDTVVSLDTLKKENIINKNIVYVKIVSSRIDRLAKPLTISGLTVTKRVQQLVESAGGKVE